MFGSNKFLRILKVVLLLVIIGLSYLLYEIIREPIRYQKEKERRYSEVIDRLKDIRKAQLAHNRVKGYFSDNWDSLLYFVKYDSLPVVRTIGDPDDTLEVIRDTFYVMVKDSLFHKAYHIDSLKYVPFTKSIFKLEAGTVFRGGVEVPVFQATDTNPFDEGHVLQVGSIFEPNYSGNWE